MRCAPAPSTAPTRGRMTGRWCVPGKHKALGNVRGACSPPMLAAVIAPGLLSSCACHVRRTDDPACDPKVEGEPFKSLFVGRISYDTSEEDLRAAFARFGEVKRLRLVRHVSTSRVQALPWAMVRATHARTVPLPPRDSQKPASHALVTPTLRGLSGPSTTHTA